jgi:hypothetical protein
MIKKNMPRKSNITGISGLSIGAFEDRNGRKVTRYIVNYKDDGKKKGKSFYFGARKTQPDAFKSACDFMLSIELIDADLDCEEIYKDREHEKLIKDT